MATTKYIPTTDSNGTSNLNHLLTDRDHQVMRLILPRDVEKAFGPGEEVDIPEKGYTESEWYFRASDGTVWGIGWRWGQARLRGKSLMRTAPENRPTAEDASEFVAFLKQELV